MNNEYSDRATKIANSVLRAIGHDISRFYGIVQNNTPMEDDVILTDSMENMTRCWKPKNEYDRIRFVAEGRFSPDYFVAFKRLFFYSIENHSGRLALIETPHTICIVNMDDILAQLEDAVSSFMITSLDIFFETKKDMMIARAIIMSNVAYESAR